MNCHLNPTATQASYFTARLLLEQDSGNLGNYVGPFGPRGQISLYTFGGPRVGNPQFARCALRAPVPYRGWLVFNQVG